MHLAAECNHLKIVKYLIEAGANPNCTDFDEYTNILNKIVLKNNKNNNNMDYIKNKYNHLSNKPSDINEHLPTLYNYATKCESVIELGVRGCVSSWATRHSPDRGTCCPHWLRVPCSNRNRCNFQF